MLTSAKDMDILANSDVGNQYPNKGLKLKYIYICISHQEHTARRMTAFPMHSLQTVCNPTSSPMPQSHTDPLETDMMSVIIQGGTQQWANVYRVTFSWQWGYNCLRGQHQVADTISFKSILKCSSAVHTHSLFNPIYMEVCPQQMQNPGKHVQAVNSRIHMYLSSLTARAWGYIHLKLLWIPLTPSLSTVALLLKIENFR